MKRIILSILAAVMVLCCQAQGLSVTDDKLDKVLLAINLSGPELLNREMQQELSLNAEQAEKVAELNQVRYQQLLEAEEHFNSDPAMLRKVFRGIHATNDKAFIRVLSQDQLRAFLELEGRQNLEYVSDITEGRD